LPGVPSSHLWLNAVLTRLFWDFLRETRWQNLLVEKVQKKLGKMHLPYFVEGLRVSELDLGKTLPQIIQASDPYVDSHGLWVKLEVAYEGSAKMSLETKLNLMRLKKKERTHDNIECNDGASGTESQKSDSKLEAPFNEDAEDSAESDSEVEEIDEEVGREDDQLQPQQQGASKRILKLIDKVAATKYFQQATEVSVIRKAMEGVSNTPLVLSVGVHELRGTLALNVPPHPSDRLWWGFETPPEMRLSVTPRVGEKQVTLMQITDWIQAKLKMELSKILVVPNMDDIAIPLLTSVVDYPRTE